MVATARGRERTVSISASTAEGKNSIFPGRRTYTYKEDKTYLFAGILLMVLSVIATQEVQIFCNQ